FLRRYTLTDLTRPDRLPHNHHSKVVAVRRGRSSEEDRFPRQGRQCRLPVAAANRATSESLRTFLLGVLIQVNFKIALSAFSVFVCGSFPCRPRFLCSTPFDFGKQQKN